MINQYEIYAPNGHKFEVDADALTSTDTTVYFMRDGEVVAEFVLAHIVGYKQIGGFDKSVLLIGDVLKFGSTLVTVTGEDDRGCPTFEFTMRTRES